MREADARIVISGNGGTMFIADTLFSKLKINHLIPALKRNVSEDVERILEKLTGGFYKEPVFTNMLVRERRRTERTKNPFLLMLIDIRSLTTLGSEKGISQLRQLLESSCREMDIKGWFRQNEIVGVIYPDLKPDENSTLFLVNRFERNLYTALDLDMVQKLNISFYPFPKSFEDGAEKNHQEKFDNLYPDLIHHTSQESFSLLVKRGIDITGSLLGILFLFPLFIIVALLIKLTSKGPVFFKQERIGYEAKPFNLLKFRSMRTGNDESVHKNFVKDFIKNSDKKEEKNGSGVFKIVNDPRVTRIGKFIRKTSIDELPQLFNVLKGDMSLVGPRPPLAYELEEYTMWHKRRVMEMRPGITGYWQVKGRSRTTFEGMVRMDIQYGKRWSLMLDLKLMLQTPVALFTAKGAY